MAKTGESFPKVAPDDSTISGLTVWTSNGFSCIGIGAFCQFLIDKICANLFSQGYDCPRTGVAYQGTPETCGTPIVKGAGGQVYGAPEHTTLSALSQSQVQPKITVLANSVDFPLNCSGVASVTNTSCRILHLHFRDLSKQSVEVANGRSPYIIKVFVDNTSGTSSYNCFHDNMDGQSSENCREIYNWGGPIPVPPGATYNREICATMTNLSDNDIEVTPLNVKTQLSGSTRDC